MSTRRWSGRWSRRFGPAARTSGTPFRRSNQASSERTTTSRSDSNAEAQDKLTRINQWYCSQLAYLAQRLAATPEPGGGGNLLDNTTILWTNELGKGNSHTLDNIPFVLVGNGLGFKMGRSLKFQRAPHNRLLLAVAHGFEHRLTKFGNPDFCGEGPLSLT